MCSLHPYYIDDQIMRCEQAVRRVKRNGHRPYKCSYPVILPKTRLSPLPAHSTAHIWLPNPWMMCFRSLYIPKDDQVMRCAQADRHAKLKGHTPYKCSYPVILPKTRLSPLPAHSTAHIWLPNPWMMCFQSL